MTSTTCLPPSSATEGKIDAKKKACPVSRVRQGRILIMDDEAPVLEVAEGILKHLGFDTACANYGMEALAQYRLAKEGGIPFSAVIMDLTIPGGTGGKETIQRLLDYDPCAVVLFSSGYSEDTVMANYRKYGFSAVLSKPYTISELAGVLDDVLK